MDEDEEIKQRMLEVIEKLQEACHNHLDVLEELAKVDKDFMTLFKETIKLRGILFEVQNYFGGPPSIDETCSLESQFSTEQECKQMRLRLTIQQAIEGKFP